MSISEEDVVCLHEANKPSVQVHLRTDTAKLIIYSFVQCELKFSCVRAYKHGSGLDTDFFRLEGEEGIECYLLM